MNSKILLRIPLLFLLLTGSVISKAQLVAKFSASPLSGCSPLIVRFTDESTGNPDQWRWDLGNGTISFLQHPSATYFSPGKYTVKLVVSNASGEDSLEKTEYIEVFGKPVIQFSASDTTGCFPLPVQFTDASNPLSGTIDSWLWDFGDGATSTLQNPAHVYTSARAFSVTLLVKNSSGCIATLTRQSMIQINTGVIADFTNDNPQTCTAPVTINFTNQSQGTGLVNYTWDFGDGNTSNLLNPTHTYLNNGSYDVKLIGTNSNGCSDTIIKSHAVTIGSVQAGFTSAASVCEGSLVSFTNTSVPQPASVQWWFGDGTNSTQTNPTKTYNSAGSFQVKMVANFGACTDSVTKQVTVMPKPNAFFTASDSSSCQAPFTVHFTDLSTNATTYEWNFGDNSTATGQNPLHTYNFLGSMSVSLKVTAANGCTDSITKSSYIKIKAPKATIASLPDSGCIPFSKTFNVSVNTTDPVTGYFWDFGDGNTSTDPSPTNTYVAENTYDVTVSIITASGCTDTTRITRAIITNNKPVAAFTATPTNTCANTTVAFSDVSTGGPTKWLWDFGDRSTSTLHNPSHQYLDTGYFDVKLTIWKGGCVDSIIVPQYIHINPPIAKFNYKSDCKKPFEKVFTDLSIGADTWFWDFGDGVTSTVKNPTHIFPSTGIFVVSLRVVNNTSGCDFTTSKQVRISDVKAQFAADDTSVCKGTPVHFTTGLNMGDLSYLNWDMGDGTPSFNANRSDNFLDYIYTQAGMYTVRQALSDKSGCKDTLIKNLYITVSGPTAKFTPVTGSACSNNAVTFTDSSSTDGTHPIQQWAWDYGDSTAETLTAPPFQHTYSTPGMYNVKLKITDSKGCTDSTTSASALVISKPKADFTTVDTSTCPGKRVRFVNQSTGNNLTYRWSFGDNSISTTQNPNHVYSNDGVYTIKLVIVDQYGCTDSITKTNYISIVSPVSMFTMSDSVGNCPPLIINFTDQSVNATSKKWDFGDSTYSTTANPTHFYNYPGTYYVKLTVTGKGGCTSTYERKVVIKGPEGSFTYNPLSGCNPVTVNFTASTNARNSFVWDFNDGSIINGTDTVISYTYVYEGSYVPKMILIDPTGCQVPIKGLDTIFVRDVDARFGFSNKVFCDSGLVSFSDSSILTNDTMSTYQWNFGDGNISAQRNPVHQYSATGLYYPTLVTVTGHGCTDTLRSTVPVKIVASPQVEILATANGCTPLTATFNGQLTVPDSSSISWEWDFANGNTSTSKNPAAQVYGASGLYTIRLTGTNSIGCKDTASTVIEAYAIPDVKAGPDFILCKGTSQSIQATGAATYAWSPATGLSCNTCDNPSTSVNNDISYVVTGTSVHGCTAKDTVSITVKNKFVLTHSSNDSLCHGKSKKLSAGGAATYVWTP